MTVLNILGAGRAGTSLARAAAAVNVPVRIAASRPPGALRLHLAQYAPQAEAVRADDIAAGTGSRGTDREAPMVVLMVPQEDLDAVEPDWLRGTVLVDATNRWDDEPLPEWFRSGLDAGQSSSEAIAAHFPGATVVKALNHVSHWDLDTAGRSPGSHRRALGVASDDDGAAAAVGILARRLGFDPVVLPDLAAGRLLEPNGPVFNRPTSAPEMARLTGGTVVHG